MISMAFQRNCIEIRRLLHNVRLESCMRYKTLMKNLAWEIRGIDLGLHGEEFMTNVHHKSMTYEHIYIYVSIYM